MKNKEIKAFSKYESLKEKISVLKKEFDSIRNKLHKHQEDLFSLGCRTIFERHPEFKNFSWTQYTTYWNDGDPTNFNANTDYIYINDEEESVSISDVEADYKDLQNKEKVISKLEKEIHTLEKSKKDEWKINHNKSRIEELNKMDLEIAEKRYNFIKDVHELLANMDNDCLKEMFGDHIKVIVTKNDVRTEAYEHD